jgi:hypothetical protein
MRTVRVFAAASLSLVVLGTLLLPACSSSAVDARACGNALDEYHVALVSSNHNLRAMVEGNLQHGIVAACDQATFKALLTGPAYDYTEEPGAIATGDPEAVFKAFCDGAPEPNHC